MLAWPIFWLYAVTKGMWEALCDPFDVWPLAPGPGEAPQHLHEKIERMIDGRSSRS